MSRASDSGERNEDHILKRRKLLNDDEVVVNASNGCKDNENIATESSNMRALFNLASIFKFPTTENSDNAPEWFYGVYIPHSVRLQCGEEPKHVYTDKDEALKVMKLSKKARLKQFRTYQEAENFAEHGSEVILNSTPTQPNIEHNSSFKGPKQPAIVEFKKAIDAGDLTEVEAAINENPRYLVSNGDTPSILQEGCRYNALHIASKKNQAAITELILSSVTSLELLRQLYDEADENALRQRSAVLLDLYLNTPEKGCYDTPLHIACKFAAVDVVEVLLSFRECRRDLTNRHNETPKEVVCARGGNDDIKKRILELMEEKFYLPVLRYEDNSMQPIIGSPFSPMKPLEIKTSPLSPRIEIQAYAGPMDQKQIKEFRKMWRTPPALMKSSVSRLRDPEKGLERVGREIAHDMKVPWKEFWPFLNTFIDLSSSDGLQLLEKYLENRFNETIHQSLHESETEGEEELSPVSHLCDAFQACSLSDTHAQRPLRINTKKLRRERILIRSEEVIEEISDGQTQFSPLLCVERSCKVFGNRIANAMTCFTTSDQSSVASEMLRDNLETEVRHLQTLITGYLEDARFHSVDFSVVHRRVAAISVYGVRSLLPSELILLTHCLRDISIVDGTVSDDEDFRFSYRPNEKNNLRAVLKLHLLCMTECLLNELSLPSYKEDSVLTELDCERLWLSVLNCICEWAANLDSTKARNSWRRKAKTIPKALLFNNDDEPSSIEESWRSCEEVEKIIDHYTTPPSSPALSGTLEETISMPDTFINASDKPTKTDLAVLEAIKDCNINPNTYPNIYRWQHLVKLHQDNFLPSTTTTPRLNPTTPRSVGKEPRTPSTPVRAQWERVTGLYSPRRLGNHSPR